MLAGKLFHTRRTSDLEVVCDEYSPGSWNNETSTVSMTVHFNVLRRKKKYYKTRKIDDATQNITCHASLSLS